MVVRAGAWVGRSDSYYYVLDHPVTEAPDPIASMRALLDQWRTLVETTPSGEVFYLPHDFSDQHTRWLRGTVAGEDISLVPGWSRVEGWSFYPSDVLETARSLADFEPFDVEALLVRRAELLADIERSVAALEGCR